MQSRKKSKGDNIDEAVHEDVRHSGLEQKASRLGQVLNISHATYTIRTYHADRSWLISPRHAVHTGSDCFSQFRFLHISVYRVTSNGTVDRPSAHVVLLWYWKVRHWSRRSPPFAGKPSPPQYTIKAPWRNWITPDHLSLRSFVSMLRLFHSKNN